MSVESWLKGAYDEKTKEEIRSLQQKDPAALKDSFSSTLEFGTGGMRGLMGPGTNRMNIYTVRGATLGVARYLKKSVKDDLSVLIGYDSRENSKLFAEEAARVLAQEKIRVFLFDHLRPVPLVSFGTRFKGCSAGIMITASHNPPEYNGYKVYWSDGGQVLPPHDKGIVAEVASITELDKVKVAPLDDAHITLMGPEVDEGYLGALDLLQNLHDENQEFGDSLSIVYTPLHGTGIVAVPPALAMWGFINVKMVEEQEVPNGRFPTVDAPNPEHRSSLKLGIEKMLHEKADLLLATDADSDRIGCVINLKGTPVILDGNQIVSLLLEHLLSLAEHPEEKTVIKSLVTTELFDQIAKKYGATPLTVLPGFKYIGQLMTRWEKEPNSPRFIFGAEESYGCLAGTYTRDKDAIIACCLLAEAALKMKREGKTLIDLLEAIWKEHGVFEAGLHTIRFEESAAGKAKIQEAMKRLRGDLPKALLGKSVLFVDDYEKSRRTDSKTGENSPLSLPPSNILVLWLEDGTKLAIRPSGTEPLIKIYGEVRSRHDSIPLGKERAATLVKEYMAALEDLLCT